MKGKNEEVKHYDKRNAYQSGDFCFSKCLASCKGIVLLDNMPFRYIRIYFFGPMLYMLKEACIG
jgi:hypothetical protein